MSRRECTVCHGARLKPEILAVTLTRQGGQELGIQALCQLTIREAGAFLKHLQLTPQQQQITTEVLREILARLSFLDEVGLCYLNLDRESGTLSGGEAQRIRLATQIGSGLAGVLYVLDEPSIGLHQRDNDRLIGTLRRLRDLGNSVIVVEHDEDTIRAADHIIDLGPGAGVRGGYLVAQGTLEEVLATPGSLTADYLSGRASIPVPRHRVVPAGNRELAFEPRTLSSGWLTVVNAAENNLRDVTAAFPLGCFTCVTGVSGSGKSTLVDDILRRALFRHFYNSKERPGKHKAILGLDQIDKAIVIDQTPIGRTPRSNPVTYTGAFGPIRSLFAQLPASRVRGYEPGRFSFNVKGGRCEHCAGDGLIKFSCRQLYLSEPISTFSLARSFSALAICLLMAVVSLALTPLLTRVAFTAFTAFTALGIFNPDFRNQLLIVSGDIRNFLVAALKPPRPFLALTATTRSSTSFFCSSL